MIWLAWRQHRTAAIVLLGLTAAFAVGTVSGWLYLGSLLKTLVPLQKAYDACISNCDYGVVSRFADLENRVQTIQGWVALPDVTILASLLLAVFLGAPLLPKELSHGTHVLAWAQSSDRGRWFRAQVAIVGLIALATIAAIVLVYEWEAGEEARLFPQSFRPYLWQAFSTQWLIMLSATVAAIALGVLIGTVGRDTIRAMLLTVLAWFIMIIGLWPKITFDLWPPVTGPRNTDLPGDAYFIHYLDAAGRPIIGYTHPLHGIWYAVYHPASHYWPLQITNALLFLALATACLTATQWWIRHRTV